MIGLARMALTLAWRRTYAVNSQSFLAEGAVPMARESAHCFPVVLRLSCEYYAIIDRLSRGEQP